MACSEFYRQNKTLMLLQSGLLGGLILSYYSFEDWLHSDDIFLYTAAVLIYAGLISLILVNLYLLLSRSFNVTLPFGKSLNRFIKMYTKDEYERTTKETTEREKEKLFQSEQMMKMMQEKGEDESKWNWQLRDRIRGKLNVFSDDELSNITVSEDEFEENNSVNADHQE